jgi:diketogulonate reductase-like aldo/keto reductase
MSSEADLRLAERDGGWALAGPAAARFGLVDEYLAYLADRNYSPKTVCAYGYDLLAFCRRRRIQVEAWSPLMKGRIFQEPEIGRIAARHGKSAAQVVLRWDLQHGVVTIPKSVRPEHIDANAAIFDFELSDEDMAALDALDRGERTGPDPDNFAF